MRTRTFKNCDNEGVVMMENNNSYKINGHVTLEKMKLENKQHNEYATFDTTLRMTNHLKNFMKAMVILGYAPTQQKALKKIQDSYMEQLGDDERKTLKFQIETLERSDALNSNK